MRGDEMRGRGSERSSEERSGAERRGEESKERRAAAEVQSDRRRLRVAVTSTRAGAEAVRLQGRRNDCTKQQRKELERSTTRAAAATERLRQRLKAARLQAVQLPSLLPSSLPSHPHEPTLAHSSVPVNQSPTHQCCGVCSAVVLRR